MARRLRLSNTGNISRVRSNASFSGSLDTTFTVGLVAQHAATVQNWHVPNFYFFTDNQLASTVGYRIEIGPSGIQLLKQDTWVAGVATPNLAIGGEIQLRVRYASGVITVTVNGTDAFTYSDSSITSGYLGFSTLESTSYFDTLLGNITEDFEAVAAQSYATGDAIGSSLTVAMTGGGTVSVEELAVAAPPPPAEAVVGRHLALDFSTGNARALSSTTHSGAIDQSFRLTVVQQYAAQVQGWHVGHFHFHAGIELDGTAGYFLQMGPQWLSLFRNNQWVAGSEATTNRFPLGVEKLVRVQFSTSGLITVHIDGVQAISYTDPTPISSGYIGLSSLEAHCRFDSLSGKITENFDSLAVQQYLSGAAIGSHFTSRNSDGVFIRETMSSGGSSGGSTTVDPVPAQEVFPYSPTLPAFAQQIICPCQRWTDLDGTAFKDIRVASANGDQIDNIIVTSTDTSDRAIEFFINDGVSDKSIGVVTIPAKSGTNGDGLRSGVDALTHLSLPAFRGDKALMLRSGSTLRARMVAAITAGTSVSVIGFGGAY